MSAHDVAVRVKHLTKTHGSVTALDDVSFTVEPGRLVGLLGHNGAGKSTLLQILTAQSFETAGEVEVFGEHPFENAGVLSRTFLVKENQRYPEHFRVRHVLDAAELMCPSWDHDLAESLLADFEVPPRRSVSKLSRGMLSSLGVTVGLASRAPLTMFDEPNLGLDAMARQRFYEVLLSDFAEHPRTIILSSHLIDEVADLFDDVLLLDRGRLVADESAEALRGRAVTVTGPAVTVDRFVARHQVLRRQQLGNTARVSVLASFDRAETADAERQGLSLEPLSLQELVVQTSSRRRAEERTAGEGVAR